MSGSEKAIIIREQINNLDLYIQEFRRCINLLPESLFVKKMDGWSPRDVIAHLIGWNLYTIEGCQQLRRGETPFYLIDPGDDFDKVNAVLVREYDCKNKEKLITQLIATAERLKSFLIAVDLADWETDFGVTYMGEAVTIKNTVNALIADFIAHRQYIEKWAEKEKKLLE